MDEISVTKIGWTVGDLISELEKLDKHLLITMITQNEPECVALREIFTTAGNFFLFLCANNIEEDDDV